MSKYGFGGDLDLPAPTPPRPRAPVDSSALHEAVAAGERLGFVSRDPKLKRRPGPKRTEPQDKVSIPGPKRVIDAFRAHCANEDLTLWQGLEQLMEGRRTPER